MTVLTGPKHFSYGDINMFFISLNQKDQFIRNNSVSFPIPKGISFSWTMGAWEQQHMGLKETHPLYPSDKQRIQCYEKNSVGGQI